MTSKIASTTFGTEPTEEIAVSDVYQEKTSAPVNVQKKDNAVKDAAIGVADALKTNIGLREVTKALTIEDGKASLSKDATIELAKNATGGPNSPIETLKGTLADEVLKAVGFKDDKALEAAANGAGVPGNPDGTPGKTKKGYLTVSGIKTIYGTVQTIRNTDITSANGLASLLNSVSGNSKLASVLGMESQFAVLGKIVSKCSELGIFDAIDMILDKLADDKERKRLLIENLRNFIYQADLYSINKVIDYVGPSGVLARVPDFVNLMMMFYRYPFGVSQPTLELRDALANTIARVDPNWYLYDRRKVNDPNWSTANPPRRCKTPAEFNTDPPVNMIGNLEPFTYASPDAIALFKLPIPAGSPFTVVANVWFIHAMIAPSFPSQDIVEKARQDLPHAVLERPKLY